MNDEVKIDGSQGEGGGQILRSSLSLSILTGRSVRFSNIRAKRKKPGLLRQHLTCVKAAQAISSAEVEGLSMGSTELTFRPGPVIGGNYTFAIGTAGSTSLVMQTVIPPLLTAKEASHVTVSGGTHNDKAPTFDYLSRVFGDQLRRAGAHIDFRLENHGFFPAGGGLVHLQVQPSELSPLKIMERGRLRSRRVHAVVSKIPEHVAEREVRSACKRLNWPMDVGKAEVVRSPGPGNVITIEMHHEQVSEMFVGFGKVGTKAERIASTVAKEAQAYLKMDVAVGPHLADQLLLPMVVAGGGQFRTGGLTPHTRTNLDVLARFLERQPTVEGFDDHSVVIGM